jgi:hypothetical protein
MTAEFATDEGGIREESSGRSTEVFSPWALSLTRFIEIGLKE